MTRLASRIACGALWLALAIGGCLTPAHAQNAIEAMAWAACGSPGTTYSNGKAGSVTINTNGQLCISGSVTATLTGSTSNATSGVATSSTNIPTVSYNYVFNGTTWDQLTSLTLGSKHAPTIAIVDASGNQITTFGTAWANTNKVIPWDGTTNETVKAANTAPTSSDTGLVVNLNCSYAGGPCVNLGPATDTNSLPVLGPTPSSSTSVGITPVVGGSAVSSLVLKGSAGNLYSVYADCTAACWLMVFNATSAPSNGATTAGVAASNMTECVPIGAGSVGGVNYGSGPPAVYSTGITAVISSTACATLTLSTVGFIHGLVK